MELNEELVSLWSFYAMLLAAKMLPMGLLTARQRFAKNTFANAEDAKGRNGKVVYNDEDVERVRRAHQNDLENIPIFLVVCWTYMMTGPSYFALQTALRVFVAARYIHTITYLNEVQPWRAIAYMVGLADTGYLIFCTLCHFW